MYIDADVIIKTASLLAALSALAGVVIAIYKIYATDKRQTEVIKEMQTEQTVICYCLKSVLEGMVEQGFNGPCKEGLDRLNKYLNQKAHRPDL